MQCPYQPLSAWVRSATTVTSRVHARSQCQGCEEEEDEAERDGGARAAKRSASSSSQSRHSSRAATTSGAGAQESPEIGLRRLPDRERAIALLRAGVEQGVNFIDTADVYGPHTHEELIREALHPYPDDLLISTKGGFVRDGPDYSDLGAVGNQNYLRQAAHMSARRLGRDHLDPYYLHTPAMTDVPFEDVVGTLADMRRSGLIRHIGLSHITADQLRTAMAITDIAAVTVHHNVTMRQGAGVQHIARETGIVFSPWHPGDLPQDSEGDLPHADRPDRRHAPRRPAADRPRLAVALRPAGAAHPRHDQHPAPGEEPRRRTHPSQPGRGRRRSRHSSTKNIDSDTERGDVDEVLQSLFDGRPRDDRVSMVWGRGGRATRCRHYGEVRRLGDRATGAAGQVRGRRC